jgi:hypothetical protein
MRTIVFVIATFAAALFIGTGSAWYVIDHGTPLTTERIGPWASWTTEGNPLADPYTKAHLARSGRLPLSSTAARYFVARTDSDGYALSASCEYAIAGPSINARWWSLAAYDDQGFVIGNPSQRYNNSNELLRRADGTYRVNLSKNARPRIGCRAATTPVGTLCSCFASTRRVLPMRPAPDRSFPTACPRSSENHATENPPAPDLDRHRTGWTHSYRRGPRPSLARTQECVRAAEAARRCQCHDRASTGEARRRDHAYASADVRYAFAVTIFQPVRCA